MGGKPELDDVSGATKSESRVQSATWLQQFQNFVRLQSCISYEETDRDSGLTADARFLFEGYFEAHRTCLCDLYASAAHIQR